MMSYDITHVLQPHSALGARVITRASSASAQDTCPDEPEGEQKGQGFVLSALVDGSLHKLHYWNILVVVKLRFTSLYKILQSK